MNRYKILYKGDITNDGNIHDIYTVPIVSTTGERVVETLITEIIFIGTDAAYLGGENLRVYIADDMSAVASNSEIVTVTSAPNYLATKRWKPFLILPGDNDGSEKAAGVRVEIANNTSLEDQSVVMFGIEVTND